MSVTTNHPSDDSLDEILRDARYDAAESAEVSSAVRALVTARAEEAGTLRARRLAFPSLVGIGVLAFLGAGVAVANQWNPWPQEADDPDISFTRDWYDLQGRYLGSCEGRIETVHWDSATADAARTYFDGLDVDALEPDPAWVAMALHAQGDLERIGELIRGVERSDFDFGTDRDDTSEAPSASDADILHNALMRTLLDGMHAAVDDANLSATGDVQCTTDATARVDQ